jgi:hippurate hydrolase
MDAARYKAGGRAFAQIAQYHPELTALRRELHAHPELGFEERYTAARVKEALRQCGVDEIHEGLGTTGLVAVIRGQGHSSGSMVGLRADMDALPMVEHNEFPWKSGKQGLMHGCGHDGHTAMLVGAARYLAATRRFDGSAVLVFQPAEEGRGGARAMINDGLFERFPMQAVYAMHNWPAMRAGTVGINMGAMMAAADRITIEITGRGGHGAHPYQTVDVVLAAAHITTAVQSIVSRNVRAIDSAVISLCAVQAGDLGAFSVMPGTATLVGTVRTFDPAVQDRVEQRLQELCSAVALGLGATAKVHYERIYPATINSPTGPPLLPMWPSRWWGWRIWTGTWSPAWVPRTFRSCCSTSLAPTCAWGNPRARSPGCRCTAAATTSTTRCCRWARPCTPA